MQQPVHWPKARSPTDLGPHLATLSHTYPLLIQTTCILEADISHGDFAEICQRVSHGEGFDIKSLGIVICGHEKISELNLAYLDRDYTTDVLAFDLRSEKNIDSKCIDGEIYLDAETATERAPEFSTTPETELRRYLIHGVLHLCGYSDKDENGRSLMRAKEEAYLD